MIESAAGLHDAVERLYGSGVSVDRRKTIAGGCINRAGLLELSNGERLFLKEHGRDPTGMMAAEAMGLAALEAVGQIRVPQPLAHWEDEENQYLLLEYLSEGSRKPRFWEEFGTAMAALHRGSPPGPFGFEVDNFIGATPQKNGWCESWITFFGERRLLFQIGLAEKRGLADSDMSRGVRKIVDRLESLLVEPEKRALLHGDLWSGNYMVGPGGDAVIIDPAAYFGHPEADLAMTELFGRFGSPFYEAYREAGGLDPGYQERRDLYNLYHMMNHLNLFGGGYAGSVRSIIRKYV
ncbi:MAG: fructosamine kinase family protein [Spirochaetota bacterium]